MQQVQAHGEVLHDCIRVLDGAELASPSATTRSSESRLACPAPACLLPPRRGCGLWERHQCVAHRFGQRDARREGRGDMLHVLAVERSRSVRAEPSGWSTRSPVLTRVGICVRRRSPSEVFFQAGSLAVRLARFCGELSSASRTSLRAHQRGSPRGSHTWRGGSGRPCLRGGVPSCAPAYQDGLLRSHPIMQNPPSREHPPSGIVIRWGARVSKRKGQRLLSVRRRSLAASGRRAASGGSTNRAARSCCAIGRDGQRRVPRERTDARARRRPRRPVVLLCPQAPQPRLRAPAGQPATFISRN